MGNLCLNTDKSSSSPINRSEYFLKPISQIFFASIHFSYVSLEMGFSIGKFFHQENEENILFFLSSPIQLHPYVSYEVSTIIYSFHIHPIAQEAYSSIISPELGDFGGACVRRKHFIQRKLIHLGGGCYNLAADWSARWSYCLASKSGLVRSSASLFFNEIPLPPVKIPPPGKVPKIIYPHIHTYTLAHMVCRIKYFLSFSFPLPLGNFSNPNFPISFVRSLSILSYK